MDRTPVNFTVMASGQLQSAEISGCGNAYAKISFYHGDDWQLLDVCVGLFATMLAAHSSNANTICIS